MKKLSILLTTLIFTTSPALADGYIFEGGYSTVGIDDSGFDVDLGALYLTGGYEWDAGGNYSHGAELLVAFGIQDDDFNGFDVDLEPSYEIAYRGAWATSTPDLSFFWRASYGRFEAEASVAGVSASADDSGFGIGIGGEWRGFTLGYTQYLGDLDDVNRINIGYRFRW